jgi:hypothetical protein
MSLAAACDQLRSYGANIGLTGRNHSLYEVANIAQDDAKALHRICLARLGLHRLNLHALQDRVLYEAAGGLEDAPRWC